MASVNSGTSSLTADSCAGCHRAHTAQGEFLLAAASEEALCLSCHNGNGATTNVLDGVQYVPAVPATGLPAVPHVVLGALRDGGYENAQIGTADAARMAYYRTGSPTWDISQRPKVPVGASAPITSAHIDLVADAPGVPDGIADKGRVWGSGAQGQLGASPVELTCVECHNPHGNGQYRILKPVPGLDATMYGDQVTLDVVGTFAQMDLVKTDTQHALVVNDAVVLTGVNGLTGTYYVRTAPNGFTFTISDTLGGAVVNLTDSTGGTAERVAGGVADSSIDPDGDPTEIENPTKNYTIMAVKGVQGTDSTFLLYARDVVNAGLGTGVAQSQPAVNVTQIITSGSPAVSYLQTGTAATGVASGDLVAIAGVTGVTDGTYTVGAIRSSGTVYNQFSLVGQSPAAGASGGTVVRQGISGTYTAAGGDYFRRAIPWNPALQNPNCSNTVYSTANSAYCATMNDAPNGRPNALISGTGLPSSLVGQQAFLDEMSTWCAACHTRYYSASNENVGELEVISPVNRSATIAAGGTDFTAATGSGSLAFGDRVSFTGMADAALNSGEWYVIYTASGNVFRVTAEANGLQGAAYTATDATTSGGAVERVYQSSNSSWGYPRYDGGSIDDTYKFQHSTASNRACTVCHVGHGSNAAMPGEAGTTFSANFPYPDASTSDSSRLLKVDNRGTCQLCHDPTATVQPGTQVGAAIITIP